MTLNTTLDVSNLFYNANRNQLQSSFKGTNQTCHSLSQFLKDSVHLLGLPILISTARNSFYGFINKGNIV